MPRLADQGIALVDFSRRFGRRNEFKRQSHLPSKVVSLIVRRPLVGGGLPQVTLSSLPFIVHQMVPSHGWPCPLEFPVLRHQDAMDTVILKYLAVSSYDPSLFVPVSLPRLNPLSCKIYRFP